MSVFKWNCLDGNSPKIILTDRDVTIGHFYDTVKVRNALFTNVHETSKIGHSDIWSHFKFNDGMIQRGFDAK